MCDIFVVEIRGFVGSDLDASVIAKKVNLFTFQSVSPQGFMLQSNTTMKSWESPIPHKKKYRTNVRYFCGGDKGIRTPDLRIANATLYQLSHIPTNFQAFQPLIFACLVIISHYAILATKF